MESTPNDESQEKKLDYSSMTSSDIDKLYPELNIKDMSGTRDGQTLIFLSQKPKRSSEEILEQQREEMREYNKTHPPTLDELM